jgi:hypothetical protein
LLFFLLCEVLRGHAFERHVHLDRRRRLFTFRVRVDGRDFLPRVPQVFAGLLGVAGLLVALLVARVSALL